MMPLSPLVLVLTRFLIIDVSSVAITAQPEKSLVRSEQGQKAAEVLSSGEMRHNSQPQVEAGEKVACSNTWDFPMGINGTHECASPTTPINGSEHSRITSPELCQQAANEAGLSVGTAKLVQENRFVLPENGDLTSLRDLRPKGCHKHPCVEDPKGVCYFYNPIPDDEIDQSRNVTGIPVCHRKKYLNGTQFDGTAAQPDANAGCPGDYGVIMDLDNCTEVANCLGFAAGRVASQGEVTLTDGFAYQTFGDASASVQWGNQSRYDDFPVGCFINTRGAPGDGEYGRVFFNEALVGWDLPKKPVGTPLCNVTVQVWWEAAATTAGGIDTSTTAPLKCDTYTTCAVGETLIPAAATTDCAADGCTPAICCHSPPAMCDTYMCPGTSLIPAAATTPCDADPCTDAAATICCQ